MKRLFLAGVLISLAPTCQAIDLTVLEFPSDDEIVEAYQSGEISEEEMHTSRDALFAYEFGQTESIWDGDIADRQWLSGPFSDKLTRPPSNARSRTTMLRYRYQRSIIDDARTKYQIRGRRSLAPGWHLTAGIDRELSGRERVRYRSLSYSNKVGTVRQLVIGNFSERLGLGSIFGPRGKTLGRSGHLDGESMLVPDFGGGNGFFSKIELHGWSIAPLVSTERDTLHFHTIAAMNVSKEFGSTSLWATASNSWLGSRTTGASHSVSKIAAGATHRTPTDRISAEITAQNDESLIPASTVVEGEAKRGDLSVHYAGWIYHDNFVDDAAGSRAGSLRHKWYDSTSGIEWVTRRSGTEGGIIKSHWALSSGWEISTTFLVSAWQANHSETRLAATVEHPITSSLQATAEYLQRNNNRRDEMDELAEQVFRLGVTFDEDVFAARTAFGVTTRDSAHYLSGLCTGHINLSEFGRVEWWADIRRIGITPNTKDYGYFYIQVTEQWSRSIESSVKLSFRYESSAARTWTPTMSVEVGMSL